MKHLALHQVYVYSFSVLSHILRDCMCQAAVADVCVEPRDGLGEGPAGRLRGQEREVRGLRLLLGHGGQRAETLAQLQEGHADVNVAVAGTPGTFFEVNKGIPSNCKGRLQAV